MNEYIYDISRLRVNVAGTMSRLPISGNHMQFVALPMA